MSFSIGALGNGLAIGLGQMQQNQRYNAEVKRRDEQDQYNRERQAKADEQATQLHKQQVQRNDQLINTGLREAEEYNRVNALKGMVGQLEQYKLTGDTDGAFKAATDYMNLENSTNPNWNQDHIFSYAKDDSDPANPTVKLNLVDKNTGQVIRQLNGGASTDSLIDMFYKQINPIGVLESARAAAAAKATKDAENKFELDKLGVKYKYDTQLAGDKAKNEMTLERYKQENSNQRTAATQAGQNYRTELTVAGKTNSLNAKTQKAVASGVNGAIQFAEQNAPMLSFLNNDTNQYLKTMAMMAIESGGQNIPSYNGSSLGHMQLNKRYAQAFAKQFGVKGDPLTDPQANIQTGAALIKHLDEKYQGDPSLVAAAYNAGEPTIDKALKAWKADGQKGGWFDYIQASDAVKNEALNHVLKYNHALSLLDGSQQQTVNEGNQTYAKESTKVASNSVQSVATKMSTELGLDKKTAPILGALAGAQSEITKFANAKTTKARAQAYNNIALMVENAVKGTEAGLTMQPQARKQYIYQYAAELVGAANKTEAGLWITEPDKKQKERQRANQQQPSMSANEIDNVFGVATPTVAKVDGIPVTLRRADAANDIKSFATNAVRNGLANLK